MKIVMDKLIKIKFSIKNQKLSNNHQVENYIKFRANKLLMQQFCQDLITKWVMPMDYQQDKKFNKV